MSATIQMPRRPSSSYREFDDAEHYEIIDGIKVELPPMSTAASAIASDLTTALNLFGVPNDIGKAYAEMLFRLPLPVDRNRRPDVAFVPFSRWPKNRSYPDTNAWDVLPDLGVEVISPFDLADEVLEKVMEYLRAGMRLVWLIYPNSQVVEVFENFKQAAILTFDDELDGGVVVPGFRMPLSELFVERKP